MMQLPKMKFAFTTLIMLCMLSKLSICAQHRDLSKQIDQSDDPSRMEDKQRDNWIEELAHDDAISKITVTVMNLKNPGDKGQFVYIAGLLTAERKMKANNVAYNRAGTFSKIKEQKFGQTRKGRHYKDKIDGEEIHFFIYARD